ncbi:jg22188 [Pararge aegeria aegeria]|uniref:Jg22188 protein n=2 Tax=Pararge aegeria TaxID=116150 RepID=A0A8S4S799_9NEOP|nr:jg22188 [Pararge aegeria aegeria]
MAAATKWRISYFSQLLQYSHTQTIYNSKRSDMKLLILTVAFVGVAFASPLSRTISIGPAIIDQDNSVSVGPAIVDEDIPISVGPAIVDEDSPISVGPAIVDEKSPISVGPAFVMPPFWVGPAIFSPPNSVGPAIIDQDSPISVGPAIIDESSPELSAIDGRPIVQFKIEINDVIVNQNIRQTANIGNEITVNGANSLESPESSETPETPENPEMLG